jgi:hypothetical protein
MSSSVTIGNELMFPSRYVCAFDLRGRDHVVTIETVKMEELRIVGTPKTQRKPVLSFHGKDKQMVLNPTNTEIIARLYGNRADDWVGKSITIFPTRVPFGKGMTDAVRVRAAIPAPRPAQQQAQRPAAPAAATRPASAPFPVPPAWVDAETGEERPETALARRPAPAPVNPDDNDPDFAPDDLDSNAAYEQGDEGHSDEFQEREPVPPPKDIALLGWDGFYEALKALAAERGLKGGPFCTGIATWVSNGRWFNDKSKIPIVRRRELWAAIDDGSFNWASGTINQVAAALA